MVGTVTLSVEVELGWGYHDLQRDGKYDAISENRRAETETLYRFLDLLDEYRIPVSFDIVDHLLLQECSGSHSGSYPDGWFNSDPGTDVNQDPLFYAPDLVDAIDASSVDHEICTHTFSHVLCDEVPRETLRDELLRVQKLHRERFGVSPVSIVTPRHREIPKSILQEFDFEVLRVPGTDLPRGRLHRLYWYLFGEYTPRDPAVKDGIVETYTSPTMSLTAYHLPTGRRKPHWAFRVIPRVLRERLHEEYLETALEDACQNDSHVHLWTHLHDMSNDVQWPLIADFIGSISEAISSGNTEVKTMSGLADRDSTQS